MMSTGIFVILASAIVLFIVVLNLVRLRRLREEYSWLWLAGAFFYLVIAIIPDMAERIASFFGITNTVNALLFLGMLFIVLILIHYSVVLSKLSIQIKNVGQMIALLDGEQYKVNGLITKTVGEKLEEPLAEDREGGIERPDTTEKQVPG